MTLATRKPTGKPSWPILLLAGREGSGKSWSLIQASASPLIGRTLYIGIGEDDPDEYALIPDANFEIVVHDGTYPGILAAVRAAVAEPQGDLPTTIGVDSMTRLWNLIGDNMQAIANTRARGRKNANGDYTISADLWNVAAGQWQDVMDALRLHQGPVILTARLDSVAVMENGAPTPQKEWKVQAHKSLVFDAAAIVEMRERGQFLITKVKSARVKLEQPKVFPGFTVDKLWDDLGLAEGAGDRAHATVHADHTGPEPTRKPAEHVDVQGSITALNNAATVDQLRAVFEGFTPTVRAFPQIVAAKDAKKAALLEPTTDSWATVAIPTDGEKP